MSMLITLILLIVISCGSEYIFQIESFPPGTKPSGYDWEYSSIVIVTSNKSPITRKSKKKVYIKIYDRKKTYYLKDNYKFVSATIKASFIWEKFDEIRIKLFEVGNKYSEDPYNKQLVKDGPNFLIELTYQFDNESRQFKRVN